MRRRISWWLILESLSFDESKFKLELFSSVCVKLIPKITENGTNSDQSENKENQPQLTNGNTDKVRVPKFISWNFDPKFRFLPGFRGPFTFWTRNKAGNASEDEIEHINNGNDFEIEDIGTFDEPEKSKPTEKTTEKSTSQKSSEKSTSKSSEKVDSESEEEVEIVKDSPSEAFWFLEDGVVKSSKDVPTHFKARVSS